MSNNPKKLLREQLLQARQSLASEVRKECHCQITERLLAVDRLQAAEVIFCFISMADEVDTHALIQSLQKLGKQIVAPGISRDRHMDCFALGPWSELRQGQLGILTPDMDQAWQGPVDVCITPGLGFSADGRRLGFGRGYYDNWFAGHPDVYRIGLAYSCQLIDAIPMEAHDVPMHMVVTEDTCYECSKQA